MKTYVVGGAVRDALLGLPVRDRDHVVVGATPQAMLAAGFRAVGKDFPVFLHPVTHEEYALARTERKTAPGYHGFAFHAAPEVTLEQDLVRRDLTINAMALADDGAIVDPYGGQRDLQDRIFRHVSPAFAEDPVRILRLARFNARFPAFRVADETLALMRAMVAAGEVDALVAERVWQEFARGLLEDHPACMLAVLHACGALARILPELARQWEPAPPPMLELVDAAAARQLPLAERFAVLMSVLAPPPAPAGAQPAHDHADHAPIADLCARLKVPNDCRDLALMLAREQAVLGRAASLTAPDIVNLFARCDAWRKPARFAALLAAASVTLARDQAGTAGAGWHARLAAALARVRAIDAGAIAGRCGADKAQIAPALQQARVDVVAQFLAQAE